MNRKILFAGILSAVLLVVAGCKKDEANKSGVFVSTSAMTNITSESATGGGDIDIVGTESVTERGICYAAESKPTTANSKAIATGSGLGIFNCDLTGLTPGAIYYARAYVITNAQTYYGNEVKFTAGVPVELIVNGDFLLPDDNVKYGSVNSIPNWKTDETNPDLTGREYDYWNNSGSAWVNDWAKPIYQVVGKVPSAQSDYEIKFDAYFSYTDWGDYKPTMAVIFSAYSGDDPTTRVEIGSVKIQEDRFYPGWPGDNWASRTGTFSIPAGSAFAGQNLVIEWDVLPYDDGSSGYDPNLWYDFDNISVVQTLR